MQAQGGNSKLIPTVPKTNRPKPYPSHDHTVSLRQPLSPDHLPEKMEYGHDPARGEEGADQAGRKGWFDKIFPCIR